MSDPTPSPPEVARGTAARQRRPTGEGAAAPIARGLSWRSPFLPVGAISPYLGGCAVVRVRSMLQLWFSIGDPSAPRWARPLYLLYRSSLVDARGEAA